VLGIPVRVHPLFWLIVVLLGWGSDPKPADILMWVAVCFVSILVHELGHALAARAHGWEPWITLYGMGGLASYQPTYRDPRAQILITFAGPFAGFALAAFLVAAIAASGHQVRFDPSLQFTLPVLWEPFESRQLNILLFQLLYINIFWGLLNLLPIYPLDGGQIAREVLVSLNGPAGIQQSLWLSIIAAVALAILAWTKLEDRFLVIFFLYFALSSYMALQQYSGGGGGGGGMWGPYR
jgi:Zn-dependent protease